MSKRSTQRAMPFFEVPFISWPFLRKILPVNARRRSRLDDSRPIDRERQDVVIGAAGRHEIYEHSTKQRCKFESSTRIAGEDGHVRVARKPVKNHLVVRGHCIKARGLVARRWRHTPKSPLEELSEF